MAIYLVLGILVHRKEIPIDLVDDAFSGPIIQSWDKLGNFVETFRARVNRETGVTTHLGLFLEKMRCNLSFRMSLIPNACEGSD